MRKVILALLSVGGLIFAQEAADPLFRESVKRVLAATTVTGKDGRTANDLKPSDFVLLDNGREQSLQVDQMIMPLSIVVCVQSNSSVEPVLANIKKMGPLLEALVMGDRGEAAVVAFDGRVRVLEDFTKSGEKIQAALNKIKPGSSQNRMIDAVIQASRMLMTRPPEQRRVILLISETQDKSSEGHVRDALLALQFQNVSLYSVNINRLMGKLLAKAPPPRPSQIPLGAQHLPPGAAMTPQNATIMSAQGNVLPLFGEILKQVKYIFVDNPIEAFTKYTGGRERTFLTQKDLERVIAEIGEELHSQYMLSYAPDESVKIEGGYHEIKVAIRNRKDLEVRSRPGYWMAATNKQQ